MEKPREQWGSRVGFILAAVGSAIGLGNIWRFPYIAYENGGGAFFIPYLFAMLTAGIPLLILEFGVGKRFRGGAPKIFASINPKWEFLGWWQVFICFVISLYYVAIIGWSICYFGLAFVQGWGTDTGGFFMQNFLQISDSPLNFGGIRWPIYGAIAFCWIICWVVLVSGVRSGIERAGKIFMPLLFVLVLVIMGRAVMLPGAATGIDWMFKPDFSALSKGSVWIAAYGQVFYSLSVGFAIMLTYASYLPAKQDVTNNAFMTAFINCGFSMLSGIMIFAVLGYMAAAKGVGVDEVVSSGVGLAFVTIPQAINLMPAPVLIGTLFFGALVFAGLSSQISICEACIAAGMEKFNLDRKRAASLYCLLGLFVGGIYASNAGLLVLDIVDHFVNNFGVLLAGLTEIILLSWFFDVQGIRTTINEVSDFSVNNSWVFCLRIITPLVLGYMAIRNLIIDLQSPYGGYDLNATVVFGWGTVIFVFLCSLIVQGRLGGSYE